MPEVKLELTLEVPFIEGFDDYHEIPWFADKYNNMFKLKGDKSLKYEEITIDELDEVCPDYFGYYGIF